MHSNEHLFVCGCFKAGMGEMKRNEQKSPWGYFLTELEPLFEMYKLQTFSMFICVSRGKLKYAVRMCCVHRTGSSDSKLNYYMSYDKLIIEYHFNDCSIISDFIYGLNYMSLKYISTE